MAHHHLANCLFAMTKFENALSGYRTALSIRESLRGADAVSHDMAASLNNLALAMSALGDHAGALVPFERSLSLKRRLHGPNHPDIAKGLHNLGQLHYAAGDFPTARSVLESALRLRTSSTSSSPTSPTSPASPTSHAKAIGICDLEGLAATSMSLALACVETGDLERASDLLARSIEARTAAHGADDPRVTPPLRALEIVRRKQGRHADAEAVLARTRAIERIAEGERRRKGRRRGRKGRSKQ